MKLVNIHGLQLVCIYGQNSSTSIIPDFPSHRPRGIRLVDEESMRTGPPKTDP